MSLDQIKENLNKKFKSDITNLGSSTKLERIPFTSARLNYLLRGGLPFPGASEISGPEGAGKTTLLNDLVKNAQKMGLYCSVIDNENKYDTDYAKFCGVDMDNLILCQPSMVSGEDILQLALDMFDEGIRFCGIDSVASLVPKSVLQGTMDDKTYCGSSGILSTFSQKLSGTGILHKKRACLVGINQVRDKLGGFGLQTPGGHFWRHATFCRLQVSKGNPFDYNYKELAMSTTEETTGHKIEVRLLKNQFCINDRRFNYCTLNYAKGIDVEEDLIDIAIQMGVIYRGGSWYSLVNLGSGEILCVNGEELKFQGKSALRDYLITNSRIMTWLQGQVNQHIND
jgi:recombination protein RecA